MKNVTPPRMTKPTARPTGIQQARSLGVRAFDVPANVLNRGIMTIADVGNIGKVTKALARGRRGAPQKPGKKNGR